MILHRPNNRFCFLMLACAVLLLSAGCRCQGKKRATWNPPLPVAPQKQVADLTGDVSASLSDLSFAESTYAQARKLEKQNVAGPRQSRKTLHENSVLPALARAQV